jgi:glucose-6-phosphate dehydrogenase assembly protein OpcA
MRCSTKGSGGGGCEGGAVNEDVWSESDTTPDAIADALRGLLRERHAANQALAPARVLNLVVVVDRNWKGEIANRLAQVGRYHASRTVLCALEEGRTTLDAWAAISFEEPRDGLGVMHEQVEIDLGPEHLARLDTVIDPVVVSELPTVLWAPHGHKRAVSAVLGMIDVMLLDSDDELEPSAGLVHAVELLRSAYVVDLAWLRTTPWRERLAASFDPPERRAALRHLDGITIRHRPASTASALLLAGWLTSRLHWTGEPLRSVDRGGMRGAARRNGHKVAVKLEAADQNVPGLAGVTVSCGKRFSLSLDRAQGGLCARQRSEGKERVWQVLGASRGEGGILGEGVRQALLRDPTYGPALDAAGGFCPA